MRIMIVDDEVIFRNGLSQVIDWQELGLTLLEPAESAEEALMRLPEEKPDILMTDIRMGGKNGLQLAEEACKRLPDLEVLILSGYDEFAYAQQAIRQKVGDYLLKTSGPEEIIKAVIKARQRIADRRAVRGAELSKEREEQKRLLVRLVLDGQQSVDPEEQTVMLAAASELLSGHPESAPTLLATAIFQASGWEGSPDYQSLLLFAVDNMLNELLSSFTFIYQQRIVAILPEHGEHVLRRSVQSVIKKVEELLNCSLFVAVGKTVSEPWQLHDSYKSADYTAKYRTWLPGQWLEYEPISKRAGGRIRILREEELELTAILLHDDLPGLRAWVSRYIDELLADPGATLESLEAASDSAVHAAYRWLMQVTEATGRKQEDINLPLGKPARDSLISSKDALFQQLNAVRKAYHHELANGQAAYVKKAIAYIESHLGRDVSLQQVAKQVHLNPSHLSEVFKKETGVTFGDYVIHRKMARAREILSVSPVKVSEVAASVGYEDVKYFSQLFKKHTGKTPSEFRENGGDIGEKWSPESACKNR